MITENEHYFIFSHGWWTNKWSWKHSKEWSWRQSKSIEKMSRIFTLQPLYFDGITGKEVYNRGVACSLLKLGSLEKTLVCTQTPFFVWKNQYFGERQVMPFFDQKNLWCQIDFFIICNFFCSNHFLIRCQTKVLL